MDSSQRPTFMYWEVVFKKTPNARSLRGLEQPKEAKPVAISLILATILPTHGHPERTMDLAFSGAFSANFLNYISSGSYAIANGRLVIVLWLSFFAFALNNGCRCMDAYRGLGNHGYRAEDVEIIIVHAAPHNARRSLAELGF